MAVVARTSEDRVLANCLASDGIGQMVHISSDKVDGWHQVEKVDVSDFDKMPAVGMIIHKFSSTECVVQRRGVIEGVYAGLVPGELLFVDDSGGLSNVPPEPDIATTTKFVQSVGAALSSEAIDLRPNFMMAKRRY